MHFFAIMFSNEIRVFGALHGLVLCIQVPILHVQNVRFPVFLPLLGVGVRWASLWRILALVLIGV